jgi:dihydrofolate reductase
MGKTLCEARVSFAKPGDAPAIRRSKPALEKASFSTKKGDEVFRKTRSRFTDLQLSSSVRNLATVRAAMRNLRVFESISVDGYFADVHGDIGWAHAGREDAEFAGWMGGNASQGGALLFGRKTYQMMEAFWPTPLAAQQMPVVAKGMNAATKYVASRTLQPAWSNTHLLKGDLVAAVRELKSSEGPDLTILGSGSVVAQLGEAGLVDGYQFVIIPVALGGGRTVFTKGCALRLVDQRAFRCGNVVVTYAT